MVLKAVLERQLAEKCQHSGTGDGIRSRCLSVCTSEAVLELLEMLM